MFVSYALFALAWAVIVAVAQPPLIVGALLVAVPVIIVGLIISGTSQGSGAP